MTALDGLSRQLRDLPRSERPYDLIEAMAAFHTPGVGIALIENGAISQTRYEGVRELGHSAPVTETTQFQSGSISKSVAAACVLRLVALGMLDLDESVNDRLRSWHVPPNSTWQPRVTLRQLLSHTAGLTVHGFLGYPAGMIVPNPPEVLDGKGNSPAVRVTTLPGLQFSYSGGGYIVAQQLLCDVTGRDFPSLAAELVLEPAGMSRSTFVQPQPESIEGAFASGHLWGPVPVTGRWHTYPEMAAAGLWSTPEDLARFFLALRGSWVGEPGALLPRELAIDMFRPHASNRPYGLGVQLAESGAPASIGHGGADEGFNNTATLYLESGQGAVIMTNSDGGAGLIHSFLLPALADACEWPRSRPGDETEATRPSLDLAGRYATRGDFAVEFRIETRGNELELTIDGQPPVRLLPKPNGIWQSDHLHLDVTFKVDDDDGPMMRLHQDAMYTVDIEAWRV
ncbi:MAG TPA: serine hydrolase domain-containing protein [Dehalococcoidia bacterium]|nr:serine hydrolase domain-containing protein [Dehalococcoidia bacterium]